MGTFRKVCTRCGQEGHSASSCKRPVANPLDHISYNVVRRSIVERLLSEMESRWPIGIGVHEVHAEYMPHLDTAQVKNWTKIPRRAGLLVVVRIGGLNRWCKPEQVPQVSEALKLRTQEVAEAKAQARRERKNAQNAAHARDVRAADHEIGDWLKKPFSHVLVSANEAPPLRVAGPRSVFDLGAAA